MATASLNIKLNNPLPPEKALNSSSPLSRKEGLLQKVSRYLGLSATPAPTQNTGPDRYGTNYDTIAVKNFQMVAKGRVQTNLPPDDQIISFLNDLK